MRNHQIHKGNLFKLAKMTTSDSYAWATHYALKIRSDFQPSMNLVFEWWSIAFPQQIWFSAVCITTTSRNLTMSEQITAIRSLEEIDKEMEALRQERDSILKNESRQALAQVKQIIAKYGFTAEQIFSETKARAQAPAKYKNPETSQTWSGRGREPSWIKDKDRKQFQIKDADLS